MGNKITGQEAKARRATAYNDEGDPFQQELEHYHRRKFPARVFAMSQLPVAVRVLGLRPPVVTRTNQVGLQRSLELLAQPDRLTTASEREKKNRRFSYFHPGRIPLKRIIHRQKTYKMRRSDEQRKPNDEASYGRLLDSSLLMQDKQHKDPIRMCFHVVRSQLASWVLWPQPCHLRRKQRQQGG